LNTGYGYDSFGHNRMVVLDVDSRAEYAAGHVPGAFLLADDDSGLWARRSNGLVTLDAQVPDRSQIDDIIKRANIDQGSVIVITGRDLMVVGRAYFTFRYWGFAREHLKVLNGSKSTYRAAGFPLETREPEQPEPCRFSVCDLRPDLSVSRERATFREMLSIAGDADPKTVIIDSRSPAEFSGKAGPSQVAFDGHIKTAINMDSGMLLEGGDPLNPLRSKDELLSALEAAGVNESTASFTYSGKDFRSAVTFLALDAVLRWPVKIYDGGWPEWGRMASIANGGLLADNSPWRTDLDSRSESITYNKTGDSSSRETRRSDARSAEEVDVINTIDSASCGSASVGSENHSQRPQAAPGY
jgi:3-mercaptopyruvate sulfurtransferase SseA